MITRITIFLLFICMAGSSLYAQVGSWVQKDSVAAVGRFWSFAFSAGGKGYAGTGRAGFSGNRVNDFWEYDPTSGAWTQQADYPGGVREGAFGFGVGERAFVGFGSAFIQFEKTLFEYIPLTNTWSQKSSHPGIGFAFTQGFVLDSVMYIGPENGTNKTYAYDTRTDTWSDKAAFPGNDRRAQVTFTANGKGYLGLGAGVFSGVYRDFFAYDPASDTWTQVADMPNASDQSSAFSVGNTGFVYNVGGGGGGGKEILRYDDQNDQWISEGNLPVDRIANASCFSIGDKGYLVFGEQTKSGGNTPSNQLWEYTPAVATAVDPRKEIPKWNVSVSISGELLLSEVDLAGQPGELLLYDLQGRKLASRNLPATHQWEGSWNPSPSGNGLFLIVLKQEGRPLRSRKVMMGY